MILYPKKNRQCIYVKGKQLQIGEMLDFTISKILTIKETDFFIFKDTSGVHYMVPTEFYTDYHFTVGQKTKGWVDKINCMGRIFIEPAHPFYKVGEVYEFEMVHHSLPGKKSGNKKVFIVVRDKMGKTWELETDQLPEMITSSIKCRVEKIKKGQLYLQPIN